MKQLGLVLMLLLVLVACDKSQTPVNSSSIDESRAEPVLVTWDTANICYNGSTGNYHVPYCITGLKEGKDQVWGGIKVYQSKDTLYRVQLMSKNGCGSFEIPYGEACKKKILLWVVGVGGKTWPFHIHGSCVLCN